jgi:hypothetical protein
MTKEWKGVRTTASYLACFPIDARLAGVGPKLVAEAEVLHVNPNDSIRIALLDWSLVPGSMLVCSSNACSKDGEIVRR